MEDICTVNLKYFVDIVKDMWLYIVTGRWCLQLQTGHPFNLYIRVVDDKLITGIYHIVGDFNFEVIKYLFSQRNINFMLGYTTFYSQIIHFLDSALIVSNFLFRAKLGYWRLLKRGYMHSLLFKYFTRFCSTYKMMKKYDEKNHDLLFLRMIKYSHSVSCDINTVKGLSDIVKPCSVTIMTITSSLKDA